MKAINVSKPVYIPRWTYFPGWLFFAIAAVLRFLNRGYDDYPIRELMDELTPDEARAVVLADIANYDKRMASAYAWSEIWNEGE